MALPLELKTPGSRFVVVPDRDAVTRISESAARQLIESIRQERGSLSPLLETLDLKSDTSTQDDPTEILVEALVSGQISLIRIGGSPERMSEPSVVNLRELGDPKEPRPALVRRWIEIMVHDRDGAPLSGLHFVLEHPDGTTLEGALDGDGRLRVDDIETAGTCRISFPSLSRYPRPTDIGPLPPANHESTVTYGFGDRLTLPIDETHRVVIEPPPPAPTSSFRGAIFGASSTFPTAAITPLLRLAQEWADEPSNRDLALGVFAHADPSGGEQSNKELSDHRARAVFALLTGDLDAFERVAEQSSWGTAEQQSMLRALGCNPGAIDGIVGPLTRAATQLFRREYSTDVFHANTRPRKYGALGEGDTLDAETRAALLDAYHAEYAVEVPAERFFGPRFMGCGEFNPLAADPSASGGRRVSLVQYGKDRPRAIDFPCVLDDASACAIDDGGVRRCKFYRETVGEESLDMPLPFLDYEWLQTPHGGAHLSALTALPDCDDLEFSIELQQGPATPEDSDYGPPRPPRGVQLARVPGMVRRGVAYALWSPPAHYDPFDAQRWFEHVPDESKRRAYVPPFQPPVFAISGETEHGPVWGLAGPPGTELRHLRFSTEVSGPATVVRNDGTFLWVEDLARLSAVETGHRVIAIFRPETRFEDASK